jgi:hypothetical protein
LAQRWRLLKLGNATGFTTVMYDWLVQLTGAPTALGTQDVVAATDVAASGGNSAVYLSFQGNPGAGASVGLVDGNSAEAASYSGYFGTDANGNNAGPIVEIGTTYYLLANSAYTVTTSSPLSPSAYVLDEAQSLCLLAGTRIATPSGPRAIETLEVGDLVTTASGAPLAICWMGHEAVSNGLRRRKADWPVRIMPDAFGPGLPAAELWMSPEHAVFVEDVLIPARCLVNGTSISHVARDRFTYWHVALASHDVIAAEGLPVESLLPDLATIAGFDNAATAPVPDAFAAPCAPVVTQGPALERVRANLAKAETLVA